MSMSFFRESGMREHDRLVCFIVIIACVVLSVTVLKDIVEENCPHKRKAMAVLHIPQNMSAWSVIRRTDNIPELTEKLHFLEDYKSPCWREYIGDGIGIKLQCLPYFYLIGAPKSGTEDLYNRLVQHPLILSGLMKEYHWLTRTRFGMLPNLSDYLRMFDYVVDIDIESMKTADDYHNAIFGDCSASTMWDHKHLVKTAITHNDQELAYTNADVIYRLNPNARIIAILRDPISRLYSDYLYDNGIASHSSSLEEFHTLVEHSVSIMRRCLLVSSERHCAFFERPLTTSFGNVGLVRLNIGFYHIFLKEYMSVFPRKQIKIIKLETYSKNVTAILDDIYSFLDVGQISDPYLKDRISSMARSNTKRAEAAALGDMLPKTKQLLSQFYKPYNDQLNLLLGPEFDYNKDY